MALVVVALGGGLVLLGLALLGAGWALLGSGILLILVGLYTPDELFVRRRGKARRPHPSARR